MFFVIESKVVKVYKIINFERDLFDRNVCLLRLEFELFVVKDVLNVVILSCVLRLLLELFFEIVRYFCLVSVYGYDFIYIVCVFLLL